MLSTPPQQTVPAETQGSARAEEYVLERFQLRVVRGPDSGKVVVSSGDELALGTAPGNDLVLSDATVSRYHCSVVTGPKGFILRDLDSTNGTKLGGYRVALAFLKPGARICAGRSEIVFEGLGEEVSAPLSVEERCGSVLGASAEMRRLFALLPRVAKARSTVLLEGETGTGKGLVAEAIHDLGPRAEGPFVVVDCGAISASLIESELFGHVRGAFTGADRDREGAFEAARGGTLFLDEIGELPPETQPKLLRVLEKRSVTPVGSSRPRDVDVRIVAATNRELRSEVNRQTFRPDLYYRLNAMKLRLPPLRDRPEDIPLLVAHFFRNAGGQGDPPPELVTRLARQRFPGNVRELRSAVERAVLLGEEGEEPAEAVRASPEESFREAKARAMSGWEREYLRDLMVRCGGNLSRAAKMVAMDRNHLRDLLRRHDLDPRADAAEP